MNLLPTKGEWGRRKEGERKRESEGGREGGRKGGREGGREGEREGGMGGMRKGGRKGKERGEKGHATIPYKCCTLIHTHAHTCLVIDNCIRASGPLDNPKITSYLPVHNSHQVNTYLRTSLVDLQCVEEMVAEGGKVVPHESNTPPIT